MTWGTFTDTICATGLTRGRAPEILVFLFAAAGSMAECSKTATQKWIEGSRNCKSSRYFPEGKLNNINGAYKFFRGRPLAKLQDLQKRFRSLGDSNSPIDTETCDMDVFCWSLVNQFLDLLGFQRVDVSSAIGGRLSIRDEPESQVMPSSVEPSMPIIDMLPLSIDAFPTDSDTNPKSMKSVQTSKPKYMCDYLKNGFQDYTHAVEFGELNPQLLQPWSLVYIADEFFCCFEHFKVADFIAIDPLNFSVKIGEIKLGTEDDGLDHVLRMQKFVGHMEIAIEYVAIYDETEEIHIAISRYITTLHKYIDFLRDHSTNSNLLGNTFVLVPDEYDNKDDLEQKSKKFRDNLQSQYEGIKKLAMSNKVV